MRSITAFLVLLCAVAVLPRPVLGQEDTEGTTDCPYLSRMPNFFLSEQNDKEFDAYQFYDGKKIQSVEGKLYQKVYRIKDGAPSVSVLQIRRNYANAIKKAGGTILLDGVADVEFQDTRYNSPIVWGKFIKGGKEVWLEVFPYQQGEGYTITVVEKEAMKQDVTASDMLKALNADGHVALYINFDVNKATIKPESQPIIDQIVEMLKSDEAVKISIEGHTDNSGTAQKNKILSEQRAKAVAEAIVGAGIDKARLSTVGWGQEKPVADNTTEEGKAQNRRVELVKK